MARSNSSPAHESQKQDHSPGKPSKILAAKSDWRVELIHAGRVIAAKLITTGNTGILLLMTIAVSLTAKLTSADLKDVLRSARGSQPTRAQGRLLPAQRSIGRRHTVLAV